MSSRAYTIRFTNENTEAWIRTTTEGKVWLGSPNVAQHVVRLDLKDALAVLAYRGWVAEEWKPE